MSSNRDLNRLVNSIYNISKVVDEISNEAIDPFGPRNPTHLLAIAVNEAKKVAEDVTNTYCLDGNEDEDDADDRLLFIGPKEEE